MTKTPDSLSIHPIVGNDVSEYLYQIRDAHIEIEYLLQSLSEHFEDNPCKTCTDVCCNEKICRESVDSEFLRFILGPQLNNYGANLGWFEPNSGCQLKYGRPMVCYEYFCDKFQTQGHKRLQTLSRELKSVYSKAFAGQHILEVQDIKKISVNKLKIILGRLQKLSDAANEALRQQVRTLLD